MKYLVILGDGMADRPVQSLGGKTPLQAADIPEMDWLAEHGCNGLLATVPDGYAPGSEIAHLAIFGYDLDRVFEGRGALEAASMGVPIEEGEMAMRCNLVTVEDGRILNHSAGQISTEEASVLMSFLQDNLGGDGFSFHTGVSYRHLLKMKGGNKHIVCTPPHDIAGQPYAGYMIRPEPETSVFPQTAPAVLSSAELAGRAETARKLNELILKSMEILSSHPVNIARAKAGKDIANSIWLWSPGYRPEMETLAEQFPQIKSGSVISAVDLIKGIGVYAGLKSIDVEGATGLYDTNYEGKAQAAIEALKKEDFVFLHIEASDEAGHDGDPELKVLTIRYLNDRIIRPILDEIRTWDEDVSIAVLPDHPTPCAIRTHTATPIPFTIYRTNGSGDSVTAFDEFSAKDGSYGLIAGRQFIELFLSNE